MRGSKPKPIEQRILEGNPAKRPIPQPVLIAGRPDLDEIMEPPDHLDKDAKKWWRHSVTRLAEVGILDRVDIPVLEQLATQYGRIRQAQRIIRRTGFFTQGSVGQIREHPAMKIEREATRLFLQIAEHYALTPVARTRLGLAELQRRSLEADISDVLGDDELRPVDYDAEVVDADAA